MNLEQIQEEHSENHQDSSSSSSDESDEAGLTGSKLLSKSRNVQKVKYSTIEATPATDALNDDNREEKKNNNAVLQ